VAEGTGTEVAGLFSGGTGNVAGAGVIGEVMGAGVVPAAVMGGVARLGTVIAVAPPVGSMGDLGDAGEGSGTRAGGRFSR
jgi:hypothetical protein